MSILQYPPAFYNPIVRKTITNIITADHDKLKQASKSKKNDDKVFAFIRYRGSVTDSFLKKFQR